MNRRIDLSNQLQDELIGRSHEVVSRREIPQNRLYAEWSGLVLNGLFRAGFQGDIVLVPVHSRASECDVHDLHPKEETAPA